MRPTNSTTLRFGALALVGVFALAACDDDPIAPPTGDPAEVEVSPESVTFTEVGETEQLSATVYDEDGDQITGATVSWSSSDDDVATVDANGLVEATGEGTATITADAGDDVTADVSVTVDPSGEAAADIEVTPTELDFDEVGATEQLSATVYDEDGEEIADAPVTWTSSDEDVAVVDEDGLVEATGEGSATITADAGNDVTAEVPVTVEVDG